MLADHKGEIPIVLLIVPYLLGIGLGLNYLSGTNINWLLAAFFMLSFTFVLLNFKYSRFKLYKIRWLGGVLIALILLLFGLTTVIRYKETNNSNHFTRFPARYLIVKINNEPALKNDVLRFTATVERSVNKGKGLPVSGTLLITIKDSIAKGLYYGDELLIPAKYNPVEPPYNPAEFNYKKYLANQNIYYQSFLYQGQYKVLKRDAGNPLIAYSLKTRQGLVAKFKSNMHNPEAIAVASTLILGYKADLSSDVLQAYSKTGTIHVLSVSGAHVAIVYVLLNLALGILSRYKYGHLLKAIIIIILVWYYSMLTGFSPAVCRAAVMISMVILGNTYNRYINTLNILALSAFVLLVYDPLFITDVGFQLSYLAVFGLVVFQPIVYKWIDFKNKIADKLWALCSVSIAAQVITFPLSAFYFHQFPVYFLLSNLFIIIPTAVIMYAGLIFLLLPDIPFVSKALAFVMEQSIIIMNKVLAFIEHVPFASAGKIWPTTGEYLLMYIIIISLFYFLYDKKLWLIKLSLACMLLLCISISLKKINTVKTNNVTFLNLKKHTGIVLKKGTNAVVLSDIKADDKLYQYSIQPFLDSCKINNIELLGLNESKQTSWLRKEFNLVQFMNNSILILDKNIRYNLIPPAFKTDYLYVTGNPKLNPVVLNKVLEYKMVVMDGSNSDRLISEVGNNAKIKNINFKTTKRNKSLSLPSK
jgi:competence protein ComEC